MKLARHLLLVLLALVLPLRSALAAIDCCSDAMSAPGPAVAQVHEHAAHADGAPAHPGADAHHEHHGHDTAEQPPMDGTPDPSATCHACTASCAASCSAVSLLSDMPVLPLPGAGADIVFPSLLTPPPSHASEGQERPPRSC